MSDGTEAGCLIGGAILGGLIVGAVVGDQATRDSVWHAAAVRHGAAHYVTDDSGQTTFVWNQEATAPPHPGREEK